MKLDKEAPLKRVVGQPKAPSSDIRCKLKQKEQRAGHPRFLEHGPMCGVVSPKGQGVGPDLMGSTKGLQTSLEMSRGSESVFGEWRGIEVIC